ncbi:MAG: LysR family transcriptional regulator [Paracoccaceae bacterium]
MHRSNWDDLRFVLAVAETGSVSAAARLLRVNHATVLRRIAGFETRYGEPIFLKDARGYHVLPDKQHVLDAAQEVENSVLRVERLLKGSAEQLKGQVRVTSTDSLCLTVLPGLCHDISDRYPDLRLSLLSSNRHLDLDRMAADITVRPSSELENGLVGEVAAQLRFGIYRVRGAAAAKWLSLEGPLSHSVPGKWMEKTLRRTEIGAGSDSFVILRELVAAGAGRALLPRILGEADPRLEPDSFAAPDLSVDIWVASQSEFAHTAKVQAVCGMLVRGLARHPALAL